MMARHILILNDFSGNSYPQPPPQTNPREAHKNRPLKARFSKGFPHRRFQPIFEPNHLKFGWRSRFSNGRRFYGPLGASPKAQFKIPTILTHKEALC